MVFTDRLALDVETFRMMLGEALEKCSNVHVRALLHGCSFGCAAIVNGGNCDPCHFSGHSIFRTARHMKNLKIVALVFFLSDTGWNARFGAIHE